MYERQPNFQQRETGGPVGVAILADQQQGPTCAIEAVENIVQLFHAVPNSISDTDLLWRADRLGGISWQLDGPVLEPWVYPELLAEFGIQAEWQAFDTQSLVNAVQAYRGVLAVVDAHLLRPHHYPCPDSWHAITVTNVVANHWGHVLEFVGLDSNFPGKVQRWDVNAFAAAASAWTCTSLLITTQPVRWRRRISHYLKDWNGKLIPVVR